MWRYVAPLGLLTALGGAAARLAGLPGAEALAIVALGCLVLLAVARG